MIVELINLTWADPRPRHDDRPAADLCEIRDRQVAELDLASTPRLALAQFGVGIAVDAPARHSAVDEFEELALLAVVVLGADGAVVMNVKNFKFIITFNFGLFMYL